MLVVSKTARRPRTSFTPAGFKDAKKKWEDGDARPLIAMMREAELDSQVAGCLTGRHSGFKRSFALVSPDDREVPEERIDFFHALFERRIQTRDLLESLFEGRRFGYVVVDFDWAVLDGRQVPITFRAYEQRYFRRVDEDGNPDPRGELRIDFGGEARTIPEEALVVETHKVPLMMPVLRDYILKEYGVETWAAFMENWGEDFVLGKYPPGSGPEYVKEVEKGIELLGASKRGTIPQGTEVDVIGSQRSTGDHQQFVERADEAISITLLGHKNAAKDSGGVNVGGQQASYEVRFDIARDDMFWLEPAMNRLIEIVGRRNFGPGPLPLFQLDKSKPVDAESHSHIVDLAYRWGAKIHPDELRKLGLYVYEDQEPLQRSQNTLDSLLD